MHELDFAGNCIRIVAYPGQYAENTCTNLRGICVPTFAHRHDGQHKLRNTTCNLHCADARADIAHRSAWCFVLLVLSNCPRVGVSAELLKRVVFGSYSHDIQTSAVRHCKYVWELGERRLPGCAYMCKKKSFLKWC